MNSIRITSTELQAFDAWFFGDSMDTCATQVQQLISNVSNVLGQSKWINQTFISIPFFENIVHI